MTSVIAVTAGPAAADLLKAVAHPEDRWTTLSEHLTVQWPLR